MDEIQQEIENQVTEFFRHMERYVIEDHNPYHRGEAEKSLEYAAQLAQVVQAHQLRRIADTLALLNVRDEYRAQVEFGPPLEYEGREDDPEF